MRIKASILSEGLRSALNMEPSSGGGNPRAPPPAAVSEQFDLKFKLEVHWFKDVLPQLFLLSSPFSMRIDV